MAYDNGRPGFVRLGKCYPTIPPSAVYCDTCAEDGAVPFTKDRFGVPHQDKPWRWSPKGWNPAIDATPCAKCHQPAGSGTAWYHRQREGAAL